MIRSLFIALLVLVTGQCFSQSLFKPLPKPTLRYSYTSRATGSRLTLLDSTVLTENVFRPLVVAGYAPAKQLVTGAGIGYQHMTYDTDSKKWKEQYGLGVLFWAAGNVQPGPTTPAFGIGPALSFLNNLISVGYIYDMTNGKWIPEVSLGVNLSN